MEASQVNQPILKRTRSGIPNIGLITQIIQHLPYYALILDSDRRVVYTNDQVIQDHSFQDISSIFGKRPGDIFQCENSIEEGCGNSKFCKYCGLFNVLTECKLKRKLVVKKTNLILKKNRELASYEFLARCSPLKFNEEEYYLLTLTDISHENRKLMLERIFYHDIINSLGSLNGLSDILKSLNQQPELKEYISCLANVTNQLKETILNQRDLTEAENQTLSINLKKLRSSEILKTVMDTGRFYTSFKDVPFEVKEDSQDFTLVTDPVLLCRVLINMLKNALEASPSKIYLGSVMKDTKARFFVYNNTFISKEFQPFIFQRNFSTKDENRGLGTYSMRLIGENYLRGKVSFTTDETAGTTFYIDIPLKNKHTP